LKLSASEASAAGRDKRFVFYSRHACMPAIPGQELVAERVVTNRAHYEKPCAAMARAVYNSMQEHRPATLVLAARWEDYVDSHSAMQRLSTSMSEMVKLADRVVVYGIVPKPERSILDCLWLRSDGGRSWRDTQLRCPRRYDVGAETLRADGELRRLVERLPAVRYVSPLSSDLCRAATAAGGAPSCRQWDAQTGPFYYDGIGHLTVAGSAAAASELAM
jgi:hypothetical protein